jgi:hypothetical protein
MFDAIERNHRKCLLVEITETAHNAAIKAIISFLPDSFYSYFRHNYEKLHGFGPLANYADRATAAYWRSRANFCG